MRALDMILGTLRETVMEKMDGEWQKGYRKAMTAMKRLLERERARREPVEERLKGEIEAREKVERELERVEAERKKLEGGGGTRNDSGWNSRRFSKGGIQGRGNLYEKR